MVAKGEERRYGMDWEFEVGRYKLLHLEWIESKVLPYSTGNYIFNLLGQTIMENNSKKKIHTYMYMYVYIYVWKIIVKKRYIHICIYIYIHICHFAVQQKLAQLYFNCKNT